MEKRRLEDRSLAVMIKDLALANCRGKLNLESATLPTVNIVDRRRGQVIISSEKQ